MRVCHLPVVTVCWSHERLPQLQNSHTLSPTWLVYFVKAPQGNERGAMASKNPPCVLEPSFLFAT